MWLVESSYPSLTTRPTADRKKELNNITPIYPDRFGGVYYVIHQSHRRSDSTPSRNDINNAYRGQSDWLIHLYSSKMDVSFVNAWMWGNTEVVQVNVSYTSSFLVLFPLFLSLSIFNLFSVSVFIIFSRWGGGTFPHVHPPPSHSYPRHSYSNRFILTWVYSFN